MTEFAQTEAGDSTVPQFSVLIAAYNQAGYVIDTLDTVAAQTHRDFELVIINDGSTDVTEKIVTDWVARFRESNPNRVVFSTTPNGGQSAAFERGFELCAGRYIALIDSDDRWLPNKLAAVAEAISADPEAGMIMHPLYVIGPEGHRTGDVRPMRAKMSEGDLRALMKKSARVVVPATTGLVIRTDVFKGMMPFPTKAFKADADAYLTFGACLAAPVKVIQEALGEYRMHAAGHYLWRVTTAEGLSGWLDMQRLIAGHFGLEHVLRRNSYFARHAFALSKLETSVSARVRAYGDLLRSTVEDPYFSARQKLIFAGFWTASALAPRPLFNKLWHSFQMKHTGHDKLEAGTVEGANSGPSTNESVAPPH